MLGLRNQGVEVVPVRTPPLGEPTTTETTTRVSPQLITEIGKSVYQVMMQEKVEKKPECTEVHSGDLTDIANNTGEQTSQLSEIAGLLNQIKMLLSLAQTSESGGEDDQPSKLAKGVLSSGRLNTKWMTGRFEKGSAVRFMPKS
jgi:hypothetical protein